MRHLISAALYALTIAMMLVMIAVYVVRGMVRGYEGESFIVEFWWFWSLMIGFAVVGAYIGEPERFLRSWRPGHKRNVRSSCMHMNEAVDLLDAFVRYAYNVEFDEFKKLFPHATKDYLLEKYKFMQQSLGGFFGGLDSESRKRLVTLMAERYWKQERREIFVEERSGE